MDSLKKLWQVQNLVKEYRQLKQKAKAESNLGPLKREKKAVEEKMRLFKAKKSRQKELTKAIKSKEMDCSKLTEQLDSFQKQLYDGKHNNPKELQNIEQKMEQTKSELGKCEEKVLELTQEEEQLSTVLSELEQEVSRIRKGYQKKVKQYEQWKQDITAKLEEIKAKSEQLLKEVEPELAARYGQSIQAGEMMIARVESGTCSGCRVDLSPSVLKRLKNKHLTGCENCSRLLFLQED